MTDSDTTADPAESDAVGPPGSDSPPEEYAGTADTPPDPPT